MGRLLVCALLVTSGCSLYFGDDPDPQSTDDRWIPDATCALDGSSGDAGAPLQLRNPENLECVSFGSPGGECNPLCGPCPFTGANDQAPAPPWGLCGDRCESLDQTNCMFDPTCRAVFDFDCVTGTGPCTSFTPFVGCFPLSQSGGGAAACEGLDSWSCSSRSDCVALHKRVCDPVTNLCWPQFVECRNERPFVSVPPQP